LKKLQGWDPFNVTEDADLGIRLFRRGYKTAIIDSTTLEEANSRVKNWIRQRSRWIKGYMQTYLVHTRQASFAQHPIHALYFHLTIGGKIAFILINPILWLATISYFTLNAYVGETIEYLFPGFVFYMAGISLVFGNFLFVYYYMIGAIEKRQWALVKYIFLVPLYWILISIAGYMALYQLLFKPHYWEKTVHGFHLKIVSGSGPVMPAGAKKVDRIDKAVEDLRIDQEGLERGWKPAQAAFASVQVDSAGQGLKKRSEGNPIGVPSFSKGPRPALNPVSAFKGFGITDKFAGIFGSRKYYFSGGLLVAAMFVGNVLNFVFNAYLGRELGYETFGLVSLINSLFYFASIPLAALGITVNNRTGFLEKRYGKDTAYSFVNGLRNGLLFVSFSASAVWLLCIPFLMSYFNIADIYSLLLFTPIWLTGFSAAVNKGYLAGRLMFISTAVLYVVEPLVKLYSAIFLIEQNRPEFVYAAIPLSIVAGFVLSRIFVVRSQHAGAGGHMKISGQNKKFPMKFFLVSILSGLSMMTFLSIDVILAKHYLPAYEAGQYALISLVGKIIYFLSTLFTIFIIPFVSRSEGAKKDTRPILWKSLAACMVLASVSYVGIGVFGSFTVPLLFGEKTRSILAYMPPFALAVACFSMSSVFVSYYLARKVYSFAFMTFFLALVQIFLINTLHASVHQIVTVMLFVGCANLYSVIILHLFVNTVGVIESNIKDFLGIFGDSMGPIEPERKLRILIFNWRDMRHRWAGGAEVYIQEIAKRWVKDGNSVTIFCGNDGHSPRYQVIDGVQIVRRGGFFTVYIWAFLYYALKFRGKFDFVVDSENGIPFLTPLYVRKPVFLLIHHVHQEVFRKHLPFVLSFIASVIEGKIMPMLYKNNTVITVSESSKMEIERLGFLNSHDIHVVHPGIENKIFSRIAKTETPTVVYLGRIKPYKNLDILIQAFSSVVSFVPNAKLLIAGDGESKHSIVKLVDSLGLNNHVVFMGKVSDEEKIRLLGSSWVAVQPSQVEGWGITVIEANACGTPVIASYVNGLKDSIVDGKTGILVRPGNEERFAEAILSVVTYSKLRTGLSHEAYIWSQNFSWDKSAKQFYEIIVNTHNSGITYKMSGGLAWQNVEEVNV
jgi:glycosyltransferase involved in cell wall biosynthesis/O-antigen/teichoic acid export membrane protein